MNDKIFRWLKFSQKAHTLYWDKNNIAKFNFANRASYLPGSYGWSSRAAMRIFACAHDRVNVSKFSLCKKFAETILASGMHWRKFSSGKNFCIYGIQRLKGHI